MFVRSCHQKSDASKLNKSLSPQSYKNLDNPGQSWTILDNPGQLQSYTILNKPLCRHNRSRCRCRRGSRCTCQHQHFILVFEYKCKFTFLSEVVFIIYKKYVQPNFNHSETLQWSVLTARSKISKVKYRVFFSLGLPLKCLSTEKLIWARLGVSGPIYVNVDSPNLGFPYFNFLGGVPVKKQARKPRSYASPKLCPPTYLLTHSQG